VFVPAFVLSAKRISAAVPAYSAAAQFSKQRSIEPTETVNSLNWGDYERGACPMAAARKPTSARLGVRGHAAGRGEDGGRVATDSTGFGQARPKKDEIGLRPVVPTN
jgi:hypothetical protein